MWRLQQFYFAASLLCLLCNNVKARIVDPKLTPKSVKIYNVVASEVELVDNTTSPDCKINCANLVVSPCPTEATEATQRPRFSYATAAPTTVATTPEVITRPPPTCNRAAHYDYVKQHCVCNNPAMDGRIRNPRQYGQYPEGDVCYVCYDSQQTRAVVFILDESGTVKQEGWQAQKDFMQQLMNTIGDVKAGVVVIAGNSYIAVHLDDYSKNKEQIAEFVRTKQWGKEWTSVGVALFKARQMLQQVQADKKEIIIFSDGDYDRCTRCPQWKKDEIQAHPQDVEAAEIHRSGIHVTYVAINFDKSPERIQMIAGDPRNIIKIDSFTAFDTNVLNSVVNTVCTVEIAERKW